MRQLFVVLGLFLLLTACKESPSEKVQGGKRSFHTDVLLKHQAVKNQGESSLCWIYAMLATIESEHMMQGDSVDGAAVATVLNGAKALLG